MPDWRIIEQKKQHNLEMQAEIIQSIAKLPKGSLLIRNIKNNGYCYLKYRKNGKVVSQYVGTIELADELREEIAKRKNLESVLKDLKTEYERLNNKRTGLLVR